MDNAPSSCAACVKTCGAFFYTDFKKPEETGVRPLSPLNENRPVRSWIPVILSLLLIIGVMTVFGACGPKEDGSWMRCHTAQIDTAIAAAILLVVFLAAAMIKNKMIFIILHVVGIVISIAAMLIPGTLVSMCMMDTMRCYAVMQPFVRIMCVLLILSALINLILQVRKK